MGERSVAHCLANVKFPSRSSGRIVAALGKVFGMSVLYSTTAPVPHLGGALRAGLSRVIGSCARPAREGLACWD